VAFIVSDHDPRQGTRGLAPRPCPRATSRSSSTRPSFVAVSSARNAHASSRVLVFAFPRSSRRIAHPHPRVPLHPVPCRGRFPASGAANRQDNPRNPEGREDRYAVGQRITHGTGRSGSPPPRTRGSRRSGATFVQDRARTRLLSPRPAGRGSKGEARALPDRLRATRPGGAQRFNIGFHASPHREGHSIVRRARRGMNVGVLRSRLISSCATISGLSSHPSHPSSQTSGASEYSMEVSKRVARGIEIVLARLRQRVTADGSYR
jgi:hypothetical protein